jgi:hypothetical protein
MNEGYKIVFYDRNENFPGHRIFGSDHEIGVRLASDLQKLAMLI